MDSVENEKPRSRKNSTSSNISADEDYRAHLSDPEETPDKITGLKFGEQLSDDLINAFADRVQEAVADEKLEGFVALQAIQLMPEIIPTMISGKKRVLQILLDSHRKHYILLEWDPKYKERGPVVYDSLARDYHDFELILNNSFKYQFRRVFGHLYGNNNDDGIPLKLETYFNGQYDNWSCGLRAAALLVVRAFNGSTVLHGGDIVLSPQRFHVILKSVMELKRKATKDDFKISEWFQAVKHSYQFANVVVTDQDCILVNQNFDPREKNYVTEDDDDIAALSSKLTSKLKVEMADDDSDETSEETTAEGETIRTTASTTGITTTTDVTGDTSTSDDDSADESNTIEIAKGTDENNNKFEADKNNNDDVDAKEKDDAKDEN